MALATTKIEDIRDAAEEIMDAAQNVLDLREDSESDPEDKADANMELNDKLIDLARLLPRSVLQNL